MSLSSSFSGYLLQEKSGHTVPKEKKKEEIKSQWKNVEDQYDNPDS